VLKVAPRGQVGAGMVLLTGNMHVPV